MKIITIKNIKKNLIALLLVLPFILTACGGNTTAGTVVKIGTTGDSKAWQHVIADAAKEDIKIELVIFSDYPQPNKALAAGEIDLNSFQHIAYLTKEIEEFGYEITPIGNTSIAPMGLYSDKYTAVSEFPNDAKVLIPDDVTNGGRALKLLEAEGLIKVDPAVGYTPTLKNITANPKNLQITELAAANIPAALADVDFAAINSGVAADAIGTPTDTAIILEQVEITSENPYVNIIAARTVDKDNEIYQRIIELYQTDEVKAIIAEDSKGSSIPVW